MDKDVTITLSENSTAGSFSKVETGQTVDLVRQIKRGTKLGADGKLSPFELPGRVAWYGGTATDLANVTYIKIVRADGSVVVEGGIVLTWNPPKNRTAGGVEFEVL